MNCLSRTFLVVLLLASMSSVRGDESLQNTPPIKDKEINLFDDTGTTGYGEAIVEDRDINFTKQELQDLNDQYAKEYKRGRMAFLFGEYKAAYKIWEPLAFQGYAKAQATMAWMYHTGKGVKQDLAKARSWYEKAAAQNHPIALNNLGVFYEQGLSVHKSLTEAAHWYKESAEWGYSYAQYNLGNMYRTGRGVKKDINKAIYWLQLAALQGVSQAQDELDALSNKAKEVKPDHVAAEKKPKWKHKHTPHHVSPHVSKPASSKSKSRHTHPDMDTKSKAVKHTDKLAPESSLNPAINMGHRSSADSEQHNAGAEDDGISDVRWIKKQNPMHYTLQLAGSNDRNKLLRMARSSNLQKDIAYFETRRKGEAWFGLIYGAFADKSNALKQAENLPPDIQRWSPWLRRFSDVQAELVE
jgi:TPR repeat protein